MITILNGEFGDLLPHPVLRKNFNKADTDGDGQFTSRIEGAFPGELDRVDIKKFKQRLARYNPEAYDGERGDMLLKAKVTQKRCRRGSCGC